ncbi:hypothetical protein G6L68_25475 [Agrobacterium fabrum]|uniref:hypothetical protein n=1 Tax=Agrobacterium fabrum TaxID=1176649 RepID=UPI000EF61E30|nr:hypothetical protein [Agrobacterium fabrum]AYM66138.1 hypothetical protein At12D13_49860 [Agrobacterium fabrum]NTE63986.1 hypothetical protein [Agrobacterium fabrum]
MYNGPAQPKELLTPSGQPETIQTLEYGYLLVSSNPKDAVLIVGRDGRDGREAVPADLVPGLRDFITPIAKSAVKQGGRLQLFHYQPHEEGQREMKVAAFLQAMDSRGVHWTRIVSLPLDFPLDHDGQLNYDMAPFDAAFESRFAVRH